MMDAQRHKWEDEQEKASGAGIVMLLGWGWTLLAFLSGAPIMYIHAEQTQDGIQHAQRGQTVDGWAPGQFSDKKPNLHTDMECHCSSCKSQGRMPACIDAA